MRVLHQSFGMIALCVAGAAACAHPPAVDRMTPVVAPDSFPRTNKTLRIANVTGGEETKSWNLPTIGNGDLSEAIIRTLQATHMFARVDTTAPADNELAANIVSQENAGLYTVTTRLSVAYTLKETISGRVIFSENIFTTFRAGVQDALDGRARVKLVKEGVVRENLRALLFRLSQAFASRPSANPQSSPPPASRRQSTARIDIRPASVQMQKPRLRTYP